MAKKKAEGPSKMAMVREVIGELGADARPQAIAEAVKAKHGVTLNPSMVSAYKSMINKKGGNGRRGRGAAEASVGMKDITTVRELIGRYGADQFTRLIKTLS